MGKDFFAKGLQKKMEKTGEDFLHSSISMRFIFYGMVWITQNPVGVDANIDPFPAFLESLRVYAVMPSCF